MGISRDNFEEWIFGIDRRIESLSKILPTIVADELDYSAVSLDLLEAWLLARYPSTKALLQDHEQPILDEVSTYVGETFRRRAGGFWNIDLEHTENAYFRIPVLEKKGKWVIAPVALTTAATDRRTGHFLSDVLKKTLERG